MAAPRRNDGAGGVLRNLLTLNISTIEKSGMTGEPIPDTPHALLDILQTYIEYLQDREHGAGFPLGGRVRTGDMGLAEQMLSGAYPHSKLVAHEYDLVKRSELFFDADSGPADEFAGDLRLTPAAFHAVRQAAIAASDPDVRRGPADKAILSRICRYCDVIKVILKKGEAKNAWAWVHEGRPDLTGPSRIDLVSSAALTSRWRQLSATDVLTIQQAWDIGTETILAQTVVQLQGDIVTRLDPRASDAVRAMHRIGVDSSLGHWHELIRLVANLTGSAITSVLRR